MTEGKNFTTTTALEGRETTSQQGSQRTATRTARKPNGESVALDTQADRGLFPIGSGDSQVLTQKPRGRPDGRRPTATLATAPTAQTANGTTPLATARRERRPRTAWELRELIRPLPRRRRPPGKKPPLPLFHPAIVEWVYQSRFATAFQIQRRFPNWLPSRATTMRHLLNLTDHGYLATANVRSTSPNFPLAYFATGRGIRLIRETYAEHGRDWRGTSTEEQKSRGQSLDSILHELLLSEFDLAIEQTINGREDLTLLYRERRFFRRDKALTYQQEGRTRRLIPDSAFMATQTSPAGEQTLLPLHFIELENGTHSPAKIRKKLAAYETWARTESEEHLRRLYAQFGEQGRKPTFRLLLIAHEKYKEKSDDRQLLDLLAASVELPRALRDRIWITTATLLAQGARVESPLAAPIWYRAKDVRRWLRDWQKSRANHSPKRGSRSWVAKRRFVADRISLMEKHLLFARMETLAG